jgi:nucleotide-binding universal stress UspA family protein/nitrite reductase/ring-hydroxylating ferredoxin subunit
VFQTIVIGTDGSPTARLAENAALMLAAAVRSELLVVSAYAGDGEAKAAAEMAVEETRRRADATGVYARTAVAEGEPSAVLVDHADRDDADLIVVGDIGLGQRKRFRLGGIPDQISHEAPCGVLIVRTSEFAGSAGAGPAYKSVLIATDGSPTASHAAYLGAELAKRLGASITLAHVGDELMGRIVLKDTAERLGDPGLPQRNAKGDPGRTIAKLAEDEESDLVVVGNKGMAGAKRVLGSVPNTVSHAAGCDVLIVHTVGRSPRDLKPGEGAIVEENGRKLAGYRDVAGKLIVLSRKCTHLGCSVQWNATLETWDCPCHGSRYDPYGKVVKGPAQRDLEAFST